MPTNAGGLNTVLSIKKQTGLGVTATGSGGQQLRRVTAPLDLKKATYRSNEQNTHQQVADFRHGVRNSAGKYSDELSPGTHKLIIQSLLRQNFVAGSTTGAITTVTAAAGPPGTFTRSAGSFITDGFKQGDIVNWTGWATTGAGNNNRNYRIVLLTATVMTVSGLLNEVVGAKASGDSVTCTVVGKKTFVPVSGQLNDYWTIEKWFADIAQSEVYPDNKWGQTKFGLPATGLTTIDTDLMGRDLVRGTSQALTSPTAITTSTATAAVNGLMRCAGVDVAIITGLEFTVNPNVTLGPAVVGSNVVADVYQGEVEVTGQFTALFQDNVLRDLFVDETEAALMVMLTTSGALNANFMNFVMNRIKVGDAAKDDAKVGIVQTFPFTALLDINGGAGLATDNTTIIIQDSLA